MDEEKGSVAGRMGKGVGKGVGKGLGKAVKATGEGTVAAAKKTREVNEEKQYTNRAGAAAMAGGIAGAKEAGKAAGSAYQLAQKQLVAEEGDEMVAAGLMVDADERISTGLDEAEYGPDEMWNQQLFTGGSPAELLDIACGDPNHAKVPKWWSSKVPASGETAEPATALRKAVWKEILQKSKLLFMLAKSAEETVTNAMHEIEGQTNGKLIGIEYRLKELPSLQRKLLFETSQSVGKTIQEVMNSRMTDTLRYTVLYPTSSYVEQAANLVKILCESKKYQSFELRNYWETGHAYDGLNCSFLTDDHEAGGVLYEVQMHTPESFDVKQYKSHALYELWRGIDHPQKKYMVFTHMVDLFDEVPRPPGDLLAIGTLNRKTSPEPDGYREWLAGNQTGIQMLKARNYEYFGVDVHEMVRPDDEEATEGATRVMDKGGLFGGGGKGKFINPMNAGMAVEGAADAAQGCFAKLMCCFKGAPNAEGSAPLISRMREDGRAPIQNPMFAAAPAAEQEQFAFIRHGEAEHNVLLRAGKDAEGLEIFDPPLTDKGRRQAEALSRYIQQEDLQFDVVFVSPLLRAMQTAEVVFTNMGSKVVVCPLLTETGMDEPGNDRVGKPCRSGKSKAELQGQFPDWDLSALDDRTQWTAKMGAEGYTHPDPKEDRVVPFRSYLLDQSSSTDKVAIVGHAAFFQNFVDVKMTSCQMLWKEVSRDDAVMTA